MATVTLRYLCIDSLQVRACEHVGGRDSFMESGQCLKDVPRSKITKELCLPPMDMVAKRVMSLIRKYGTRSVFVASDVPPDVHGLEEKLGRKVYLNHLFVISKFSSVPRSEVHCELMMSTPHTEYLMLGYLIM